MGIYMHILGCKATMAAGFGKMIRVYAIDLEESEGWDDPKTWEIRWVSKRNDLCKLSGNQGFRDN
jgi:hypothetical protein